VDESLDEHLVPAIEHRLDSGVEGAHAPHHRALLDSHRRVFSHRLADGRESNARDFFATTNVTPARDGQAGAIENSVDDVLSERERGRPAGAARERDAKELEHRYDHRL